MSASAIQYCLDILNAVVCYVGYNAIYAFSVCQIFYERMRIYANSPRLDYIKSKLLFLNVFASYKQSGKVPKYFIECFKKDDVNNKMNKTGMHYISENVSQNKEIIEECNRSLLLNDISYIIYNALTPSGSYDKIIITNKTMYLRVWENNKIVYKCTTYDFMSVQLKFTNDPENVAYNIALNTDKYDFYIEGNILNYDFIMYYCNEILNIGERLTALMNSEPSSMNRLPYTLTIVDEDVNVLNVTDEQTIVLGEFVYTCG